MGTTHGLMTVEQFLALPEEHRSRKELVAGKVVETGDARVKHELVKSNTAEVLFETATSAKQHKVLFEAMFLLDKTEARIPDVALVSRKLLTQVDLERRFTGAPVLAVEVVSSETASDLEHKVEAYLRNGSAAVWVIYPDERMLMTHHPDGMSRRLHEADLLQEPALLPAFQVKVSRLFEGLAQK